MKLLSPILKLTKHVIQIRNWKSLLYQLLEKHMFVSHTNHTQRKINGFTSFAIDNMYYVSFWLLEQKSVPWWGEIQNQRSEVFENTFNLHSNSTYCPIPSFHVLKNFVCFSPHNWLSNWVSLLGLSNWAFPIGL